MLFTKIHFPTSPLTLEGCPEDMLEKLKSKENLRCTFGFFDRNQSFGDFSEEINKLHVTP